MRYIVFNNTTGIEARRGSCPESFFSLQALEGETAYELTDEVEALGLTLKLNDEGEVEPFVEQE